MIALRLTCGYRKSGDDREWRRELASNLPPASRHPRRILTSKMTPLSAVWLCPWRALRTCLDSVGVHSAYTTAWRRWYKRREWTGRQLCCRRTSLGGAQCHRRIDGIGRHGARWRHRLDCNTRRTAADQVRIPGVLMLLAGHVIEKLSNSQLIVYNVATCFGSQTVCLLKSVYFSNSCAYRCRIPCKRVTI